MKTKPQNNTEKGKFAEQQAAIFLEKKGYRVLATNYRHGRGEIDLIATENNVIVFVEVKSRKNATFGQPEIAVNHKKQALIQQAAEGYLEELDLQNSIRFDIIAIVGQEITHFEDAF
jgi:putative endonuclease